MPGPLNSTQALVFSTTIIETAAFLLHSSVVLDLGWKSGGELRSPPKKHCPLLWTLHRDGVSAEPGLQPLGDPLKLGQIHCRSPLTSGSWLNCRATSPSGLRRNRKWLHGLTKGRPQTLDIEPPQRASDCRRHALNTRSNVHLRGSCRAPPLERKWLWETHRPSDVARSQQPAMAS